MMKMTAPARHPNIVDVGETYARLRGYTEVNRGQLLAFLDLHSRDVVYQGLSSIVTDNMFQGDGTIVSQEAEKKKAEQQQQEAKQTFDDRKAERDTMSRHPLARSPDELKAARRSRKKNQAQDKKDKAEPMTTDETALTKYPPGEEEEDLYPPEVNEAWSRAMPQLVKCFEAIGFGVAVSQTTLQQLRVDRAAEEQRAAMDAESALFGDFLEPLPETPDEDFTLHVLDPRTFRTFVRRDESYGAVAWLIMLPIVVDTQSTKKSPEEARIELMSRAQVSDCTGKTVKWYVLDPRAVFVYAPMPENTPCVLTGDLRSYISRLEPERGYEIANRHAMAQSNLVNASAPIPVVLKAGNMPKVDGSGESGNSHEDARENVPQARISNDSVTPSGVDAPGHIAAYRDPAVERAAITRQVQEMLKAEKDEDRITGDLRRAYSVMESPMGAVTGAPVRREHWTLPERYELGAVPVAQPPTYYVEQIMKRWREAACVFRVVVGVLLNYSVMDGSSDTGTMGGATAGGKEGGLGGATSGTTSTAWRIFRTAMNAQVTGLEAWSKRVLQAMADKKKSDALRLSVLAFMEDRKDAFDRANGGNEAQYSAHLMNSKGLTEDVKQGMQHARRKRKEAHMSEGLHEAQRMFSNGDSASSGSGSKKRNDLLFKIPRVQTLELLVSFWEKKVLTSVGLREEVMRTLYLPEQFLELPEVLDEQREASLNPLPEVEPDDGEEGGGAGGAKKKAKKS